MRKIAVCNNRLFLTALIIISCAGSPFAQKKEQTLHELNQLLINTVMDDVFTPPVACRIYTYPNIAFYECIRYDDPSLPSLAGKLNELSSLPSPDKNNKPDHFIAACVAFSRVGQSLVGSEYKLEDWRNAFVDSLRKVMDTTLVASSVHYGNEVADAIIAWYKKDHYAETRGYQRYVYSEKPGRWKPTPLEFAQALEPYWKNIRPLVVKKADQFSPSTKLVYSMSKNAVFYKNVMEVYTIGKKLDSTRTAIAWYWDDNPNIAREEGHFNYFIHKISPGGHWIMITRQACLEKHTPVTKASQAYALTAIALFDGFICCWYEKYLTDLIRPVTVINRYIDPKWAPLIQTPPFPEFTSGHAVISNAAATVLTSLFGEKYSFTDNTEIPFGMAPRTFPSFLAAAEESSWSRVYGGIHYPETARISIKQGRLIGANVISHCYKSEGIPK